MFPSPPLSLALIGLEPGAIGLAMTPARGGGRSAADRAAEVRAVVAWACTSGFRAVQLNAATPGIRPRDLDRSGRRDLAATLRRSDLTLSGLDLFIPPEHFTDPAHVDRAVSAMLGAIDLAAELGALAAGAIVSSRPGAASVSTLVPAAAPADAIATITDRARTRSVQLADFNWPARPDTEHGDAIGIGLDPATVLAAGEDPVMTAAKLGRRLFAARVTDIPRSSFAGQGRVAPGTGKLELPAYLATLVAINFPGHAVFDLRGLSDPADAIPQFH